MSEIRPPYEPEERRQHRGTYILLPVSQVWVYTTIVVSWLLNISPLARPAWSPDFLALTLVFWNVREPRLLGMFVPFLFGILMDAYDGTVLGQHALVYTWLSYISIELQRRLPWFSLLGQTLHILPIFLGLQCFVLFLRLWLGGEFPGWSWFGESFFNAILWPVWSLILLWPQRRPQNKDDTRPI